jgi:Na+/melibiose symporter-like transporter
LPAIPLHRNRDFLLLQTGQLLSATGTQTASLAYPLLVLAVTGSAAQAGLVAFARMAPMALLALPAGLAADRWRRKRLMIGADAIRAVAIACLAAAVALDQAALWTIVLIALVEGAGTAVFHTAQTGALRAVVSPGQLPAAAAVQSGRHAAVRLVGPPIGGLLFGLGRALPFVVDAVSYAFSSLALLAMCTPFQEERRRERASLRAQLHEGFRFLWSRPFLRACSFYYSLANFIAPGLLFSLVVIGAQQGLSGGEVGVLVAVFGLAVLVGSPLSALVRRRLPASTVMLLEPWAWLGCAAFLVWPSAYVLAASIVPAALAIPSTDSIGHGYRVAMTPDRLLGRVEAVWTTAALTIAPLGPLAAGLLLTESPRAAIGVFVVFSLALALYGTLNPAIRAAPPLSELDQHAALAGAETEEPALGR